jgi:hypothetical protein
VARLRCGAVRAAALTVRVASPAAAYSPWTSPGAEVRVVGACGAAAVEVARVALVLAGDPTTRPVAVPAAVGATARALASNGATAANAARVPALQRLAACQALALMASGDLSLLGMGFGPAPGAFVRGALVGNWLLVGAVWALVAALAGAVVAVRAARGLVAAREHGAVAAAYREALAGRMHAPSVLLIPVAMVLQPTVTSAVLVFSGGVLVGGDGGGYTAAWAALDAGLVVATAALVVGLVAYVGWALRAVRGGGVLRLEAKSGAAGGSGSGGGGGRAALLAGRGGGGAGRALVRGAFEKDARWVAVGPGGAAFKARHLLCVADYRTPWFLALDLCVSVLLGAVFALPTSTAGACVWQLVVVALCYAALLCVAARVRPLLVPFEQSYVVAANALGLVSALLMLLGVADLRGVDARALAVAIQKQLPQKM